MEKVVIRNIQKSDVDDLFILKNNLSQEKILIAFQGEKISKKEIEDSIVDGIKQAKNKQLVHMALEVDGKVIGTCSIRLQTHVKSHVGMLSISLAKEYRGKGLGKKLMKKTIAEARKHITGLKIITLSVYKGNFAIKLYEQLGFKQYGVLKKGIKYKGKYIDEIKMVKYV